MLVFVVCTAMHTTQWCGLASAAVEQVTTDVDEFCFSKKEAGVDTDRRMGGKVAESGDSGQTSKTALPGMAQFRATSKTAIARMFFISGRA